MKQPFITGLMLGCLLPFQTVQAAIALPIEARLLGYEGTITSRNLRAHDSKSMTTSIVTDGVVLHWHQTDPKSSLISAASTLDCGSFDYFEFKVHLLGTGSRKDICNVLWQAETKFKYDPNTAYMLIDKKQGMFYRTAKAWYRLAFDQDIALSRKTTNYFEADLPRYHPKIEDKWGISQHGVLAHYTQGEVHLYAPGEVIPTDDGPYTVKAVMSEEDLFKLRSMQMAKKIGQSLAESSKISVAESIEAARREGAEVTVVEKPDSSEKRAPVVLMLAVVVLAAIGGITLVRLIVRWIWPKKYRGGLPPEPERERMPPLPDQPKTDDQPLPPPIK